MGLPVVTVATGGLPIVESTGGFGTPVTESTIGRGVAVTKVIAPKPGLPVIFETIGTGPGITYATLDGALVNTTLSNGNLTATHSNTATDSGARSASNKTTGKLYFEVIFNTAPTAGSCVGIMKTTSTLSDPVTNGFNCSCAYGSGGVYSNSASTVVALGVFAVGDKLSVAVDLASRLAWFRRNAGAWNVGLAGTNDPATGVGGLTFQTPTDYVPFVGFSSGGSGNNVTMNFGTAAFAYAVPSGFTAGWPV